MCQKLNIFLYLKSYLKKMKIKEGMKETVIEFLETLENDDDVQNIFSNVNIGEN